MWVVEVTQVQTQMKAVVVDVVVEMKLLTCRLGLAT